MYITEEDLIKLGFDHEGWSVNLTNADESEDYHWGRADLKLDEIDPKHIKRIRTEKALRQIYVIVDNEYYAQTLH